MKLKFIIPLIFLIFASFVYSDVELFNDNYQYFLTTYTDFFYHTPLGSYPGSSFTTLCPTTPNTPQFSNYLNSYAFGQNTISGGCNVDSWHSYQLGVNMSYIFLTNTKQSGNYKITGIIYSNTSNASADYPYTNLPSNIFNLGLSNTLGQPILVWNILKGGSNQSYFYYNGNTNTSYLVVQNCNYTLNEPFSFYFDWRINLDDDKTSLYLYSVEDSSLLFSCENQFFNYSQNTKTKHSFNKFEFSYSWYLNETFNRFIDDITIYSIDENITILYPENVFCSDNSECLSHYCLRQHCALKTYLMDCDAGYECMSGSCVNNKCTKESLIVSLTASKNELYGNDEGTNNFISLIIIIFITAILAVKSNILVGVGTFIVLLIFFTIIGWLSPFILLGGFVLILGTIALLMFMGSQNG